MSFESTVNVPRVKYPISTAVWFCESVLYSASKSDLIIIMEFIFIDAYEFPTSIPQI